MSKYLRGLAIGLLFLVGIPTVGALVAPFALMPTSYVDNARLAAVAHQHANFSAEQRAALKAEIQSEMHPHWQSLSVAGRIKAMAIIIRRLAQTVTAAATPVSAAFLGNQTAVISSSSLIALQRQADCSLTRYDGSLSLGVPPSLQLMQTTPNYEQTLHGLAGLTTKADAFAQGCVDPMLGIGSRRSAYLGKTTQGLSLFANSGYDTASGANALFYKTVDATTMAVQTISSADVSLPGIAAIAVGDLNGDGLADVVGIDATSGSIGVWLANANGTLGTPTFIALPGAAAGSGGEAAVLADVNGDGKVDVVVATCTVTSGCDAVSGQEQIWVLTGNGNGTLNTAQPLNVPSYAYPLANLVAADLTGSGHLDLVGSNGLVLMNNGSGAFTAGTPAFAASFASSSYGPNLAAGDFNHDGKMDIAVNNSADVYLYLGNGDGTFTAGKSYASVNDVGYITATDLDGDGNVDLFVGQANGGLFGGDQFESAIVYALMGNGDGSFQGAANESFTYTGSNVADLNGDKILDVVGVDANGSLTSYLGDGKGGFSAKATLAIPTSVNGEQVSASVDGSFALGDVNGDGIPDLIYNAVITNSGNPGVLIALGNGQGGFGAPTLYTIPSTLTSSDIDESWTIANLKLADLNGDGKTDLTYSYTTSSYLNNVTYTGTVVQLGSGDGTFQAPLVLVYGSQSAASSMRLPTTSVQFVADMNKDGIPDLVFLGGTTTINIYTSTVLVQVALGKGDGTFGAPSTVASIQVAPIAGSAPVLVAGDVNGDGIPDISVLASDTSQNTQLQVFLGKGDGTFGAPVITSYAAQYLNTYQTLALADFNGDGKLDVAIFDPYTDSDSGISLGNGDGTFQTITSAGILAGGQPTQRIEVNAFGTALSADFNGDGKPDLLVGSTILLSQGATVSAGTATTTSLSIAPTSASVGQPVTLTATVASVGGTPSGSVSFLNGNSVLGTAALSAQGSATFSSASLTAGAHSLSAQYSGDSTYAQSTSSAVALTISATSTFVIAASPTAGSVAAGASVSTTLTLTPSGNFSGAVNLACSGLPSGATCSFSPASVTLSGSAAMSVLTISTGATAAQLMATPAGRFLDPFLPTGTTLAGLAMPFLTPRLRRRSRSGKVLVCLGALIVCLAVLHGCGGHDSSAAPPAGGATPAGAYSVTVTGTSGSSHQTVTYALTVT